MTKKTSTNMGLYLVKPEVKPGLVCPVPQDAKPTESQKAYYARKYMEIHAADTNARVQSEIDEITRRMIDVEQRLLTAQNTNDEVTLLQEELTMLQTEREAKRGNLIFLPIKKI